VKAWLVGLQIPNILTRTGRVPAAATAMAIDRAVVRTRALRENGVVLS
jgi:hypothetical protein